MPHTVAIVNSTEERSYDAVQRAIHLVGGLDIPRSSHILIKPNLTSDKKPPESGVTTHASVVEAIVQFINATFPDCTIDIVESDSDGTAEAAFEKLGYGEIASHNKNVRLVNLSKERTIKLLPKSPKRVRCFEIPEALLDADYFISVANLKRHINERITCIWKNNWGLPSNHLARIRMHPFLSEALFDFNALFWPDLCFVDAIVGLEGPGPLSGYPVPVGKIVCGKDPVATDIVAARMMGEDPWKVPHLKYAMKKLSRNPRDVVEVGDPVEPMKFEFVGGAAYRLGRSGLYLRKLGLYLDNFGYLTSMGGYALRVGKPSDFFGGKVQSIGGTLKMVKDLITRFDVADRNFG
jgi:uncharacterized protein (DUF362 family)